VELREEAFVRLEVCGESEEGGEVRTSFEDLRRNIVEFDFELFEQRLDLCS